MASGDLLGIGVSALQAFQRSLATTGNNVANVNTPGYSRQRVDLTERNPQLSGNGYIGTGVVAGATTRIYSDFLTSQVRTSTTGAKQQETFYNLASQVDQLLGDPQAGLQPAVDSFFNSVQQLANNPSAGAVRQTVLSEANSLAARFGTLNTQLKTLQDQANNQISDTVSQVNNLASSIADLNQRIINATGQAGGQAPNALLDQRDELLRQLSEQVAVTTVQQDNGAVNVFIGKGQTLVAGTKAASLTTVNNPYNASQKDIAFVTGSTTQDITDSISGGVLGGVLQFRSDVLNPAFNSLGRVAIGLADTFNAQHELGQDLKGNPGGQFFADLTSSSPTVTASSNNAATTNVTVNATITDTSALTASDYLLSYDGTNYTLVRQSDNQTVATVAASGFPQTINVPSDGLSLTLNGSSISVGDTFLVQPTHNGAGDFAVAVTSPDAIAAAAPIRTAAAISNTGDGTVSAGAVNGPPPPNASLGDTVSITFTSANTYNVVDTTSGTTLATGASYTSGADISYNGWTAQISGSPASGDVFTVQANTNGVGDNRNALLLAGLQSQNTLQNGTASYQGSYSQMVANVGVQTNQADMARTAQESVLNQATAARDAVSGVNLDEEASNLLKFQQAYQAAAQIITTANNLFNSLITAVRQ